MVENSKIEWTDHTFNPWLGCTKVSPACDNCYAEGWARRTGNAHLWDGERRRTTESYWRQPIRWNAKAAAEGRRMRVFCSSLADVFDNQVPRRWRDDLWHLIARTPHLDWLLLTKRPQNIRKMLPSEEAGHPPWGDGWPNVALGTTVENQPEAERRIPYLLAVPARVHFLSCEPMLEAINLRWLDRGGSIFLDALTGFHTAEVAFAGGFGRAQDAIAALPTLPPKLGAVDWVICGGESGPKARPMHPAWARSLRDQCRSAFVPYFFKQWGEWHADALLFTDTEGRCPPPTMRIGKKKAGALLDGREWREIPHV